MMGPQRRGMAASWTWVPPALSGRQVEGTGFLPLGKYQMPDGSTQVSFGLPQGLLDAYRSMRYGLGYEQDPNAPKGYVSEDTMLRGAIGGAGSAFTGTIGAGVARGMMRGVRRGHVSSGGVPAEAKAGIKAWHGSPHDFDQFSMKHVGSGEGAQAYGHGLYFAENKGVAQSYRDALGKYTYDGMPVTRSSPDGVQEIVRRMNSDGRLLGGQKKQISAAEAKILVMNRISKEIEHRTNYGNTIPESERYGNSIYIDAYKKLYDEVASIDPKLFEKGGKMYRVEINADPARFILYDEPLAKQPKQIMDAAISAMKAQNPKANEQTIRNQLQQWTGGDLVHRLDGPKFAKQMADAGIPGIKYLDGGSRTAGAGTNNYVIFDDTLIKIAEKYGMVIPGPNGLPAVSEENWNKLKQKVPSL